MLFFLLFYAFMMAIAFSVKKGNTPVVDKWPRDKFDDTLKDMNSDAKKHVIVCVIIMISALVPIIDSFLGTVTVRSDSEYGKYEQVSRLLQFHYSSGFGVFLLVVSYALFFGLIVWIFSNRNYEEKNRLFLERLVANYDEYQARIMKQQEKEEEENQRALASLSTKYGDPINIIKPIDNKIENAFIVFPESERVYFNKQVIPYHQIIGCEVKDNAYTTIEGQKTAVTTTNTGSAIGRSVVGGLVAGPAGAIIGGATAKKETEITENTKTIIHHHYFAVLKLADATAPLVTIDCGTASAKKAEEIKAIIDGIVIRTSKANIPRSITDELLKLAELKEKGLLTEAEFEQQKLRILNNS